MSSRPQSPEPSPPAELDPSHEVIWPARWSAPLVISSPHSGSIYPEQFLRMTRLEPLALRRSEDAYMDALLLPTLNDLGAPMLRALFPRAYLDVNREPYELDPRMFDSALPSHVNTRSIRVAGGLGTIARVVADGQDIYHSRLPVGEAMMRIDTFYRPYHASLRGLLEQTLETYGQAFLLDCHSMPSSAIPVETNPRGVKRNVDIVLGDRYGTSASAMFIDLLQKRLSELGYLVRRNKPYAGGFITEYYGNPSLNCHAVQIEVNRALYMDERSLIPHEGFDRLKTDMALVIADLIQLMQRNAPDTRQAAE